MKEEMVANIVEILDVTKQYKDFTAVDHISLSIPKGQIFGLLGPNGAGKTTLIRMITQIISVDEGKLFFDGRPLERDDIYQMGYMPEERGLYKKMKVHEHLVYLGTLHGMSKTEIENNTSVWYKRLAIEGWKDHKVADLSKGMQQKIQFISTVMHSPKLLILDEPFSGLDPVNANLIRNEIDRLVQEENMSVIFSTHRMEQVEEICDYIGLINKGRVVLEGRLSDVKNYHKQNLFTYQVDRPLTEEEKANLPQYTSKDDLKFTVQTESAEDANKLLKSLLDRNYQVMLFEEELPSIQDIFIQTVSDQS